MTILEFKQIKTTKLKAMIILRSEELKFLALCFKQTLQKHLSGGDIQG